MDPNGRNCELLAGGMRNVYSIGFNADGELFGADNDHERDIGLSWYRPCRLYHLVPGGDYGHRQGTGKFPEYYEDALPPVRDLGLGGPSGIKFAPANCAFPPPFHDACFLEDWAYGRLLAVHLFPHGASYEATVETILRGKPLNLTAMEFGPDGALYFIVGGRNVAAGLYRLSWDGSTPPAVVNSFRPSTDLMNAERSRRMRRELESFEGRQDPRALNILWPSLASDDRWLRYAARRALESQDIATWKNRALAEDDAWGGLTALLALARCGKAETQPALLAALDKFPFSRLNEAQQLLKLRVVELSLIRQGRPEAAGSNRLIAELDALYPSADDPLNNELCQVLLYLNDPRAVAKTMALIQRLASQEQQIYYLMRLRNVTNGWTLPERKDYFASFSTNRLTGAPRPERPPVLQ